MSVRLLIADDHDVMRSALLRMVEGTDVEVVGQAGTVAETLALAESCAPDVLLLDLRMPDGTGIQALEQLRSTHPSLPVLMLTTYENPLSVRRLQAQGAAGSFVKGSARELLLAKIRAVISPDSLAASPVALGSQTELVS